MTASLDVFWTRRLLATDAEEFDRFVAESRGGHYAQTRSFRPVESCARSSTASYVLVRERGRLIAAAMVSRPRLGPLALPWAVVERGPVCERPNDVGRVASALAREARAHGVLRLFVMPYWAGAEADVASRTLSERGFRDAQRPDGPHARTLRIDLASLAKGQEAFLEEPGRDHLRRRSTQATKAGAVARRGTREDFEVHRRLTDLMMREQGRGTRSSAYYEALWTHMVSPHSGGSRGALFVGQLDGRTLATAVILRHGGVATYAQGATTRDPNKISKSVPPLLAALHWAYEERCHTFDLGGIPDERDTDAKRNRIAHLKLDFAREPVRLVREHVRTF